MSWSLSIGPVEQEHVGSAMKAAPVHGGAEDVAEEQARQVEAATIAAVAICQSGALGEGLVYVNASGHANPGHNDRPGWSRDIVTLNVNRAPTEG